MMRTTVTLIVIGIIVLGGLYLYNRLVRLRNRTDNAWAQVDVQLRRRYDLIPNLVETVKGYAGHEKETLEAVTAARNSAVSADSIAEQGAAEGAPFIEAHMIQPPARAFDDFAGGEVDQRAIRRVLGLD